MTDHYLKALKYIYCELHNILKHMVHQWSMKLK